MSSSKSLAEILADIRAKTGEPFAALNDKTVARLIEAGTADGALKAGDAMPEFTLPGAGGGFVRSADLLARGPVVICFYRGEWCPYCSAELEALHTAEPAIRAAGATLVAITGEAGGIAAKTKRQRNFKFDILCDLDNGVGLGFGVVFRLPQEFIDFFLSRGTDLSQRYDNGSWFLPIPATYIVGKDGMIVHAYVNPDFRERMAPNEIVSVLEAMK